MSNQEYSRQPDAAVSVDTSHEVDPNAENLSHLLPQKLRAMYPDAKIAKIQPTHANSELTLLISSASAVLEPVTLEKSMLAAYENGLIYCTMKFMPLKGESEKTIAYIPKYVDRPEIRHKGINAEFYQKLYAYLKSQGIRYVFGLNQLHQDGSHTRFFLEKLGRSTFDELPAEFAAKLPERFRFDKSMLTVQFL